ncbi:uncharacterized protein LACBIDRAFT_336027 [Laccaria bicolor S238N-H82]|uniref:Predicted protein n=1 Tax=Laccaria bicolor (strain S238N-H82 / ATCC MYA-4686) TaxID=486041 RepID=B0E470_LACBS|nr:uncharacterized protein LACBIDRAFT_336027 [Laccaria bicolor S238N-H82]EDQ98362.1 predicted protein [Laccaria bicolor S238N-H82]|eukprot:XP_001890988.1 predicted protein [Laccaria bicolor S238N-H82]
MEARVLYSPFDDAVITVGCRVTALDAFRTSKPRSGANSLESTAMKSAKGFGTCTTCGVAQGKAENTGVNQFCISSISNVLERGSDKRANGAEFETEGAGEAVDVGNDELGADEPRRPSFNFAPHVPNLFNTILSARLGGHRTARFEPWKKKLRRWRGGQREKRGADEHTKNTSLKAYMAPRLWHVADCDMAPRRSLVFHLYVSFAVIIPHHSPLPFAVVVHRRSLSSCSVAYVGLGKFRLNVRFTSSATKVASFGLNAELPQPSISRRTFISAGTTTSLVILSSADERKGITSSAMKVANFGLNAEHETHVFTGTRRTSRRECVITFTLTAMF